MAETPRHEPSAVGIKAVVLFGLGLAATVLLTVLLTQVVLDRLAARRGRHAPPPAAVRQPELPPEPRLQTAPTQDLATLLAREDAVLGGYGWVDRKAGVVRLPIDRAIELVAARGLPLRGAQTATPAPTPARRARPVKRRRR
jgi:hypothetical protein